MDLGVGKYMLSLYKLLLKNEEKFLFIKLSIITLIIFIIIVEDFQNEANQKT